MVPNHPSHSWHPNRSLTSLYVCFALAFGYVRIDAYAPEIHHGFRDDRHHVENLTKPRRRFPSSPLCHALRHRSPRAFWSLRRAGRLSACAIGGLHLLPWGVVFANHLNSKGQVGTWCEKYITFIITEHTRSKHGDT